MFLKEFFVGVIGTNCYLAGNEKTKEMLIIDPGDNAKTIIRFIEDSEYTPVAVLLTHGHFDHCMAARDVAEHFGVPVYVHEADKEIMENPAYNCCGMIGKELSFTADQYFHGEHEQVSLAGFTFDVFHTPGHTPGGVCFYFPRENILFSGDTLFCESVGRTDFPKGSMGQLARSIKEKLLVLPDITTVLPGHNEQTTIGNERQYNPFL